MRKQTILMTAFMLLSTSPALHAQSVGAVAGWMALMTTPVGGLGPSIVVPALDGSESGLRAQGQYAHWQFAPDDDNTTNLAVGVSVPMSQGRVAFQVGRTTKKDCSDCDAILVGVDLNVPLTQRTATGSDATFGVAVEPSVGFMKETASGTDWSAFALGVSLPLTMTVPSGSVRVVPFVSPGVGFGQVSSGGDSRSGERAMLAGGVAVAAGVLQITAGVRKVFIEHGVTVYGVSLSVGL